MSMVLPPTSRLRFLDAGGAQLVAPREWRRGLIEVLVPASELSQMRLLRQGEPLQLFARLVGDELGVFAEWPLSGTGHYRLTLELGDVREEVEVAVEREKISPQAYARM